jgi:3'-5' exoribonuclease
LVKKIFVEQIRERDWIDSPFLVRDKIMAMAKNGKPYMTLKLVDRTGEVEGRLWDRVDEFSERFSKNDFIRVQGKSSVYLGKMQLVVQDLARLADDDVELADYLPVATRSTEELVAELRVRVDSLADPHLRGLLEAFLADAVFLQRYATAPAAKTMHHVYLGGLLEHSLAVADLADDVSRRYPGVQRDLLVVGALLHDIGKVDELCYERSFDYTDEGKLIGHIVMGVEMVEEKVRQMTEFPRGLATLVKHLLLSHHGQYEFGSPKRPKTLEAVILHFLDDLDSKINGVRSHIERDPDNGSSWTSYHRLYDRYFFKEDMPGTAQRQEPSSAPLTAPARPAPTEPKPEQKPEPRPERTMAEKERKRFGFTLADQLKGKSLDLFTADEQDKE